MTDFHVNPPPGPSPGDHSIEPSTPESLLSDAEFQSAVQHDPVPEPQTTEPQPTEPEVDEPPVASAPPSEVLEFDVDCPLDLPLAIELELERELGLDAGVDISTPTEEARPEPETAEASHQVSDPSCPEEATSEPEAKAQEQAPAPQPRARKSQKSKPRRTSGALTIPSMLRLMRLEFDKAQRFQYPIVGLIFAPDGLDQLDGIEGARIRKRVMPAVFNLLKKVTGDLNIQGLGSWTGNRQLALFPHVAPWNIEKLTETLLERARNLPTPDGIPPVRLSIGVAHNQHSQATTFDALLEEAEKGLSMAMQAGGDRHIQFREVEEEAAALRDEMQQQMENLAGAQAAHASESEDFTARLQGLTKAIRAKFARYERDDPALERIEHEVVGLVRREIQRGHSEDMRHYKQQIDLMDRRIAKLNAVLETTENELKRVAELKVTDDGIASIYKDVQGLSDDESQSGLKHEMMSCIFQANLELRQNAGKKHSSADDSCAEEVA